jgi:hypothetical protein
LKMKADAIFENNRSSHEIIRLSTVSDLLFSTVQHVRQIRL